MKTHHVIWIVLAIVLPMNFFFHISLWEDARDIKELKERVKVLESKVLESK